MKLSDMIGAATRNMNKKAVLKEDVKITDGPTLKAGTVSTVFFQKPNGNYHFEAQNTAVEVSAAEITISSK